jgi:hypothetical protein
MRKNLILACYFFATLATLAPAAAAEAKSAVALRSGREPGQTDRVVVRLEVGGETKSLEADKKTKREKMSVVHTLDYCEKFLAAPTKPDGAWRSVRDYRKVEAKATVGDAQFEPALRPEHRLIAAQAAAQATVLFSPAGNLARDELDAIEIQADSLLLDRLLPEKPVTAGDKWEHSAQLVAALLSLDEVAKTTVQSTLTEVTDIVARFELAGKVEGAVGGVSTKIEIKGKYRFDLRTKRIDWLGMLVQEDREASFVEDGIDVVARLQMTVTPAEEPASLAEAALAKLTLEPSAELTRLLYESPDGGWQCQYDRRWFFHRQSPKSPDSSLRLVDRGMLVGQCNLSSLPRTNPEKLVSLEDFQEDVRKALGKAFGEFVEAGQSPNAANCGVYRVVAQGTSSQLAVRWIYYLVADSQGHRAALTFVVEQALVERFADADKPLVQTLRFTDPAKKDK